MAYPEVGEGGNPLLSNNNVRKRAENRVRVVIDIQNFAQCARHGIHGG